MKKIIVFAMASILTLSACGKKADENKGDDAKAEAAAEAPADAKAEAPKMDCSGVTVDSIKALAKFEDKDGKKLITEDSYVEMLGKLPCCTVDDKLELNKRDCIVFQAIKQAESENSAKSPSAKAVMGKLIKSDYPIVRAEGYKSINSIFDDNSPDAEAGKEAIKNEKDPYALKVLAQELTFAGDKDASVAEFMIRMTKHENPIVRNEAAGSLSNSSFKDAAGAIDTLIALMSDSDETVAATACRGAGDHYNEKIIEPIVKILNDNSKAKLHFDCMTGLSRLWLDSPSYEHRSEAAYKATMDYFKKTPRTSDVPNWLTLSVFNSITINDDFAKWKQEATYFNQDEFTSVMSDLIKDENFGDHISKSSVMKAIAKIGGKAELEKIGKMIEGLSDDKVKEAYAEKLAEAK